MEYLIPIWWTSVSKIVQKHCGTRFSHCSGQCKQLHLFIRGSKVTKCGGRGLPMGQLMSLGQENTLYL